MRRPHSPQQSVPMLGAITTLLVYQLVGEVLVQFLDLPVPGPVVGMLLLFLSLWLKGSIPDELHTTANTILQHLSLLFVPAGVGVMVHFSRVSGEAVPIIVAVLGSTALAIAAAALTMQALIRPHQRGPREEQR
jgi:holin-like protein